MREAAARGRIAIVTGDATWGPMLMRLALALGLDHALARLEIIAPNGAALVRSKLDPQALLRRLQKTEAKFGRRRMGHKWRARVLDLDIILWSGGAFASDNLSIPHPLFRTR